MTTDWEYKVYRLLNLKLEEELNYLGSEGWELISWADPETMIFKRKKIFLIKPYTGEKSQPETRPQPEITN